MVLSLREGITSAAAEKALGELCESYWRPLYAYARRRGHQPQDAEDLTQGFFKRLLERNLFARADPARGRLRSFLLSAFRNYMAEEWRIATREKRGQGQAMLSLDEIQEPACHSTGEAELLFDRIWFDYILERALEDLQEEYRQRGKLEVFRGLRPFLAWNKKDAKLAEAASQLKMAPGTARVGLLRMRQRFRELIEREIGQTVSSRAEAAEELNYLRRVLAA